MMIECELCHGHGHLPNGERCPCREEDDDAREKRSRMGIIRPEQKSARHEAQP
jgi:hypothetical protein